MPPLRTFLPVKPIKTERTHEENQERAYIAASRRSDRSLEARVESARRASEIHKRRTGRSLRVTEQDVINEEMYEEEDDDLPSQYRRLTAHLQTGSADFNRRLAAYLTNHVAMRSALDQAITTSYAQQFPDAPQFAHNHPSSFPSPFQAQAPAQPPVGPQSPTSPHPYRQIPYPMPGMPGYRQNSHHRSTSMSIEKDGAAQAALSPKVSDQQQSLAARRVSMLTRDGSSSDVTSEVLSTPSLSHSKTPEGLDEMALQEMQRFNPARRLSPFTTSLPPDTQQLLGAALDPNDPFTTALMSGSGNFHLPLYGNTFYNYMAKDIEGGQKDGMNSTLAPALEPSQKPRTSGVPEAATESALSMDFDFNFDGLKGMGSTASNSEAGSGNNTPDANGGWDAFIDETSWAENAT